MICKRGCAPSVPEKRNAKAQKMIKNIHEIFTTSDIEQIQSEGLTPEEVRRQIEVFKKGIVPVRISRPCSVSDGIDALSEEQGAGCSAIHDRESLRGRMIKFVPASGAATRMFESWYRYLNQGKFNLPDEETLFLNTLSRYPFYSDLSDVIAKKGGSIEALIQNNDGLDIISYIITEKGMDYGRLPKCLIKFHRYENGSSRTPLEEHLVEAALYTRDASGACRLHFTVPEAHKDAITRYLEEAKAVYERAFGVHYRIGLSVQLPSTNTIAVNMENYPFRDENGRLTFRPGGHGALLANLQKTAGDIVFVKNVDNVAPDRLKPVTVRFKKMISGYLISLQEEMFEYLRALSEGKVNAADIAPIVEFCEKKLHLIFPAEFKNYLPQEKCDFLYNKLNRPVRVCGMVKNEGEPGGGPFWVEEGDGTQYLQIIEAFQIDHQSESQRSLWLSGTYFNPVDLVCGLKDFRGNAFDLNRFVDNNTMCIAQKSEKGKTIKALERPGLWNGAMSFWNTVFVETPIETFNPVKVIDDLLRPSHQPS